MSIRAKVVGCFVAVIVLFGGVSTWNYSKSLHTNSRLGLVNDLFLPLSRIVAHIQSDTQGLVDDIQRYYFQSKNNSEESTFSRMVRDLYPYLIDKRFAKSISLLEGQAPDASVTRLKSLLTTSRSTFKKMASAREPDAFEGFYVQLRAQLKRISSYLDDEAQSIARLAQAEGRENLISGLFLSLLAAVLGVFTVWLSHRVLTPLPHLIESIKKISDGDFNQSLKVRSSDKDEIAELAREYNRMLDALKEQSAQITEQQKELLQSERLAAVGQLSAEIVHEIRNPLNSMSLNVDWLQQELDGVSEEVGETLQSISKEIERLHWITESYLVRARVPRKEGETAPVHELIEEILNFSQEEYRRKRIRIEKIFSDKEIKVNTDRSRLKQALLNVFRNAKDAMPNGGILRISSEVKENVFQIRISDTGYGMNETTRNRAFKPFFTTKTTGTGLGMMLTKSIVEEAQGTIQCESEIGKGTTFTFQFPV